jgi:hypothetical protein
MGRWASRQQALDQIGEASAADLLRAADAATRGDTKAVTRHVGAARELDALGERYERGELDHLID